MARRKSRRAFLREERGKLPLVAAGDLLSVQSTVPFGAVPLTPPAERALGATSLGDTGIGALVAAGFGQVPPTEDTRPGQAVPLPVAEPPASPLRPREGGERRKLYPTKEVTDFLHDAARDAFVRFGDLDAARRFAIESVKSGFDRVETKGGWMLRPKGKSVIDVAVGQRAGRVPPPYARKDEGVGASEESSEVAARRKDWEAAARSGDPDAMTRTANALIRAVEADRAARGEAPQTGTKTLSGRHPIDEILAPRKEPDGYRVIVPHGALDAGGRPIDVPPQSDADVPPGHIATADGAQRVGSVSSDADPEHDWVWDKPGNGDVQTLSPEQMKWAANRIMQLPEGKRAEVLRQFGERYGEEVMAEVAGNQWLAREEDKMWRLGSLASPSVLNSEQDLTGEQVGSADRNGRAGVQLVQPQVALAPGVRPSQPAYSDVYDDDADWQGSPWGSRHYPPDVWTPPYYASFPEAPTGLPVLPGVQKNFQPGVWRREELPLTARQNVLVDPEYLPPHLKRNLNSDGRIGGRQWLSPTGASAGYGFTDKGPGYFGGRRDGGHYHGGLDFKGTDVVLPTNAKLIDITYDRTLGYTMVFDLGDGIQMSLLHVKPSGEILAQWASGTMTRHGAGIDLSIGQPLGTVDRSAYGGTNDHVHLQINLGPGLYRGRRVHGFVVNPMGFF